MRFKKILYYFSYTPELLLVYLVALEMNFLWLFGANPSMSSLKNPDFSVASEIYTADSVLIGKYFLENRTPVTLDKISPLLIKALIATEDVRFYEHNGIDIKSSLGIFWHAANNETRGGSTITQQLAKNLFKTRHKTSQGLLGYIPFFRTLIFKTKELVTARKIELLYSKNEILNMYLNTVDFGNNTFGICVAARTYFNTRPDSLNTQQAAMLVGMLKAPSTYNPLRNPESALERRNVVLSQMLKYALLTKNACDSLKELPLGLKTYSMNADEEYGSYIRVAVSNFIKDWAKENDYDIYSDGLKIYSTIDSRLQSYAELAVSDQMKKLQKRFNQQWGKENPWIDEKGKEIPDFAENVVKRAPIYRLLKSRFKNDQKEIEAALNKKKPMKVFTWKGEKDTSFSTMDSVKYYLKFLHAGMMTFDPFSGYIKAWVGGIDYKHFKYEHVKQAKRQAGSTFKPFVYATALDNGYAPCDKIVDKPISIKYTENGIKKVWEPHNSDWEHTGEEMTLRRAMAKSVNSVTAHLTEKVGWQKVADYAHRLGIVSPLKAVPSIGLGSSDVSVFEMVNAYGTFLNHGLRTEPILVSSIVDKNGKTIKEFKTVSKRVLSEETAYLMLYMFKGGMEEPGGTSQGLWEYDIFGKGNEVGGKTGTTSNYSDGWYMGITKDLVTGVWVGASERSIHFKSEGHYGEGATTALPIYGKYMEKVYKDKSTGISLGRFPKPDVKITKAHDCTTKLKAKPDSLAIDTLAPIEPAPTEGEIIEVNPSP
jgi:penicillin-binding protein 1A